jgi:hypothetical protein
MSKIDTTKFLEDMTKWVEKEAHRTLLDTFSQKITSTASGYAEGYKEGYSNLKDKPTKHRKSQAPLPELSDNVFQEAGEASIKAVYDWARTSGTGGTLVLDPEGDLNKVTYYAARDIKSIHDDAKKAGVEVIQAELSKLGTQLGGFEKDVTSARESEIGLLKAGLHRAHQKTTTVGAAKHAAVIRYLKRTRLFKNFWTSEHVKGDTAFSDLVSGINATFATSGTKKSGPSTKLLNEDMSVEMEIVWRARNTAIAEDYDSLVLGPKFEKKIVAWIEEQNLHRKPGSASIEDNAEDVVTYMVLKELTKGVNAKVKGGPLIKPKGRKKKKITEPTKYSKKPSKVNTRKAKTNKRASSTTSQGIASSPLQLIGLINKELPNTVRKNMQSPALVNRTGRFAESVRLTDVVQTPKGYPSFGYTYQRNPYQVFEDGSSGNWSNGERDPRELIDKSIREIAAQFAIGRFYTRRQ